MNWAFDHTWEFVLIVLDSTTTAYQVRKRAWVFERHVLKCVKDTKFEICFKTFSQEKGGRQL